MNTETEEIINKYFEILQEEINNLENQIKTNETTLNIINSLGIPDNLQIVTSKRDILLNIKNLTIEKYEKEKQFLILKYKYNHSILLEPFQ